MKILKTMYVMVYQFGQQSMFNTIFTTIKKAKKSKLYGTNHYLKNIFKASDYNQYLFTIKTGFVSQFLLQKDSSFSVIFCIFLPFHPEMLTFNSQKLQII